MIVGIGTDLVDLDRFRATLARRPGLIDRLFTPGEREYAQRAADPTERLAVRFAAKEATLKALGVGIGAVDWHDIEVVRDGDEGPVLQITGRAALRATALGITSWRITLTHGDTIAQAVVLAQGVDHVPTSMQMLTSFDPDAVDAGGPLPIVTPAEMAAIDAAAPEPVAELIERAGAAVSRAAIAMLGGTYGRRVVVLCGKGNNGNDGRAAARRLRARGVRVLEIDAASAPAELPECDLVIDAAYGTGFRGEWHAPRPSAGALVLAVDIPSGIDGLTGVASGRVLQADVTVTFAALKPGLLFADGLAASGHIEVADIGLDVSSASSWLVGAAAVASWLPDRHASAHKWQHAVHAIAGAPGMGGAAGLVASAALRAGAGYARVSTPGGHASPLPIEAVSVALADTGWAAEACADLDRFAAITIGNGLGVDPASATEIRQVVATARDRAIPLVIDADALTALGADARSFVGPNCVLTPHDGEFARLAGAPPGTDRIAAARSLSADLDAIVLLKGRTTLIAAPDGTVHVSIAGDERLATAGTGDVLTGIIAALLAGGLAPVRAAAAAAFLHGRAGALGWPRGLVAGDLVELLPAVLDRLDALRPAAQ